MERCYWSRLIGDHYLVYKLLHLLHGMVSLQQRRHSHETFVAATVILFLLLLLVIFFVYSSVLWDVLTRREKTDIVKNERLWWPDSTERRVDVCEMRRA